MNRPIKFRAWDKHRKVMVTDFMIVPTSPNWSAQLIRQDEELNKIIKRYYEDKGDILASNDYTILDWSDWYGIDNLEIMQFTGLYDKEGKEIYEGDIIQYIPFNYNNELINVECPNMNFFHWYSELQTMLEDFEDKCQIKVIGNIYEQSKEN